MSRGASDYIEEEVVIDGVPAIRRRQRQTVRKAQEPYLHISMGCVTALAAAGLPATAWPLALWVLRIRFRYSKNLVTGRQLRAARVLAGLTQRTLGAALGVDERAVRFWERKHDRRPTSAPNDARIEQALLDHGIVLFAEPTPGARLAK